MRRRDGVNEARWLAKPRSRQAQVEAEGSTDVDVDQIADG